jgi:hypothetical protein
VQQTGLIHIVCEPVCHIFTRFYAILSHFRDLVIIWKSRTAFDDFVVTRDDNFGIIELAQIVFSALEDFYLAS